MPYAVSSDAPAPTSGRADTMTAAVRRSWGPPAEVLAVEQIERPTPGRGEVLVEVRAAGVDRGAWHLVTGLPRLARLAFGIRAPKRPTIGLETAGVVAALGPGATGFEVGQAVYGNAVLGSFAEYAIVKADKLTALPAGLSFVEAAACPISGSTALQAVQDRARVQPGERVLVTGAAGGVGTFAVQIARHLGAEVTATARPAHRDLVRSLGAQHVIDHTATDAIDLDGQPYDVIIDIGGHRSLRTLRGALTPRGRLVIVGSEPGGAWLGGTDRQLRALLWSPSTRRRLMPLVTSEGAPHLALLADLLATGAIVPQIDRTFPLEDVVAALAHLTDGHPGGKVVLEVSAG